MSNVKGSTIDRKNMKGWIVNVSLRKPVLDFLKRKSIIRKISIPFLISEIIELYMSDENMIIRETRENERYKLKEVTNDIEKESDDE